MGISLFLNSGSCTQWWEEHPQGPPGAPCRLFPGCHHMRYKVSAPISSLLNSEQEVPLLHVSTNAWAGLICNVSQLNWCKTVPHCWFNVHLPCNVRGRSPFREFLGSQIISSVSCGSYYSWPILKIRLLTFVSHPSVGMFFAFWTHIPSCLCSFSLSVA